MKAGTNTSKAGGEFQREESVFRNWLSSDGATGFKAEPGRYQEKVEPPLSRSRYLAGNRLTEANWRLFTTLVRFDAVYYNHFKCNLRRIAEYPNLSNYLLDLFQVSGVSEAVNLDHIKRHYYASHTHINPTGIVPKGRWFDFTLPHAAGVFLFRLGRRPTIILLAHRVIVWVKTAPETRLDPAIPAVKRI